MMSDSDMSREIENVVQFGLENGVLVEFTPPEVRNESLNWVYKLFPENCEEEERYLLEGNQEEIKTKYVMMHCLLELWYPFHHPEVDHRSNVFNKVMLGRSRGWIGCENANDDLNPNRNPIGNIEYFSKFEKGMFDCVGI